MKTPKHKPEEYTAIRSWLKQSGSYEYYISNQQEKAADDGAPLDAIYERYAPGGAGTKVWVCVSDLKPHHSFRLAYEAMNAAN